MKLLVLLFLISTWLLVEISGSSVPKANENNDSDAQSNHSNETERYEVAKLDWEHVQGPFMVTIWLLLASLFKIGKRE